MRRLLFIAISFFHKITDLLCQQLLYKSGGIVCPDIWLYTVIFFSIGVRKLRQHIAKADLQTGMLQIHCQKGRTTQHACRRCTDEHNMIKAVQPIDQMLRCGCGLIIL